MEIRRFAREDLEQVVAVEEAAFPHDAMPGPTFVQFGEIYPNTFLVAVEDSLVVGYVLVAPSGHHCNRGLVIALGVHPEWQRRGIGTALMDRVLTEASAAGLTELELTVDPDNLEARRLYEKFGFSQVGDLNEDYFGRDEHRLRMAKIISTACDATDGNLQAEASTSVAWSNLLVAITGAALAGLIAVGSVNAPAYWYVLLALLGALYSSQYYANVSGVVGRLHRNHDPERLLIIGNSVSEYLSFYPLVLAIPLLVMLLTDSAQLATVALIVDLLMFGFYQLGSLNVERRQAGRRSSVTTFVLMSLAAITQVAAVDFDAPLLLVAVCAVATTAFIALTLRGVRGAEA